MTTPNGDSGLSRHKRRQLQSGATPSNVWETFAQVDPYFYILTKRSWGSGAESRDAFFQSGELAARHVSQLVAADLQGHSLAIEIGCGVGRILLNIATDFQTVRGVDVAPTMLSILRDLAKARGQVNVETYLSHERWDEPAAAADYVYSYLVFQHIDSPQVIEEYVRRSAAVLRPGGIAQLQFDTRPRSLAYRLRPLLPDRLLPRTYRRGIRRVRRDPEWIRALVRDAGLTILREHFAKTSEHWFILRR